MTPETEAAVRAAADALVAALVAVVEAEATPSSPTPERLLSINEAAAVLGVGRSSLYRELGAGRLRSLSVGRRRLIPASAITDYAARQRVP
jgi:excisionase family DNA binding protein